MSGRYPSSKLKVALSYCVQQVRSYDYENYQCLLHLPTSLRRAAFALRAFNVETARVRDTVSDARLAMMRLLWWRDAVDNIYKDKVAENPVVESLASVIHEHNLSKQWLKRLVEARIEDTEIESAPVSVSDLERYAENTASVLLYLTLQAGGIKSTSADHVATHIGKASGLTVLLKAIPHHAARRRSYIPHELAAKHGLSQEDLFRGENTEALTNAVYEMACVANSHLKKARELSGSVPKASLPVFLPSVPCQVLLDSLEKRNFNVLDPTLTRGVSGVSPLWFQLKVKWYAFREKY